MKTLLLLLLCAPARAQAPLPSVGQALEQARQGEVPVAPAPPRPDIGRVELDAAALADAARLKDVTRAYFEAFLEKEGFNLVSRRIATTLFNRTQEWTIPFLQSHFERVAFSMEVRELDGARRRVMITEAEYNGKKVVILRYRDGLSSVGVVSVDGTLQTDEDGEPLRFLTKDRAAFEEFVEWFHGRLGEPEKR